MGQTILAIWQKNYVFSEPGLETRFGLIGWNEVRSPLNPYLKETFVASGLSSLMLLLLSWPAFRYYFYAEAFWALRIYNQHGRHLWQAAFSKIDGMFFRPGFFLAHIAWIFILPPNPLIYH